MINRILIRIKVVQMLYSYLLTGNEFRVDAMPLGLANDKRYTYGLYIDLLLLVEELAGLSVTNDGQPSPVADRRERLLSGGSLVKALANDDTLRQAILKANSGIGQLQPLVPGLHEELLASAAYADYQKLKKRTIADEARMWGAFLSTTVIRNPRLQAMLVSREGHTVKGTEEALRMAVETLDSSSASSLALVNARADLQRSLDKAYELYISLFALIIELTRLRADNIEAAKNKHLATAEDINPNMRFVRNPLVRRLEEDPLLTSLIDKYHISWRDQDPIMLRQLLDDIMSSEPYRAYMEAESTDWAADCDLWRTLLKDVVFPSDALAENMESRSVFWNDDLHITGTFVLKILRQMSLDPDSAKGVTVQPQYKDEEDARLGDDLFMLVARNRELYRSYIDQNLKTDRWEADRLAFMDIVIMVCAIAELINYLQVPTAVIMNEYVEMANAYSTPRSGQFINGILFAVLNDLKARGIIPQNRP